MKALVALLLLCNLAFLAWSQGWLDGIGGMKVNGDREPERLARQLRPESVVVLEAGAATDAIAAPPARCLEAGPFDDAQWARAQAALQAALPNLASTQLNVDKPGSWIVYMGRYATREAMARKEDELKRRQIAFDEVTEPPALAPGLALGRFGDRTAAASALGSFEQQGVRTARVVETAPASVNHLLRVEKADAAQAATLLAMKPELLGKGFVPCTGSGGG